MISHNHESGFRNRINSLSDSLLIPIKLKFSLRNNFLVYCTRAKRSWEIKEGWSQGQREDDWDPRA